MPAPRNALGGTVGRLDALARVVCRGMTVAGGAVILLAALLIGVEVFMRRFLGVSVGGIDELSGYALAISSAWAFAFALLQKTHVRIDTVYLRFGRSVRPVLDVLALLVLGGFAGLVITRAGEIFLLSARFASRSISPLATPLWIPPGLWLVGWVVFGLVLTAEVKAIFDGVRPKQVKLIKAIADSKQVKDDFLHKKYNEKKLWDFGVNIITHYGYDWSRGRQDKAPHPFETTFNVNDVRITTRFEADNPMATLFSTMHESGHAMYEQGINPAYERTPLTGGTSLAIHESQSRMWENLVGRSLPFWEHFFPVLKKIFPSQLQGVNLKSFYKAIKKVEPLQ